MPTNDVINVVREDQIPVLSHQNSKILIKNTLSTRPVVLLGPTGCGKTTLWKEIAQELNYDIKFFYPSQWDPTDIKGFPFIKDGYSGWAPHKTFTEEPKKKTLWVFDELPNANTSVQAILLEAFREHKIADVPISNNVYLCGAGNLTEDSLAANDLIEPLAERCALVYIDVPSVREFIEWNTAHNISDASVFAYLSKGMYQSLDKTSKKSSLYRRNPTDRLFPCPRAWTDAMLILMKTEGKLTLQERFSIVASCVGEGTALEWKAFATIEENIPSYDDILSGEVEFETSKTWALLCLTSIAMTAVPADVEKLMAFAYRLPPEYITIFVQLLAQNKRKDRMNQTLLETLLTNQSYHELINTKVTKYLV